MKHLLVSLIILSLLLSLNIITLMNMYNQTKHYEPNVLDNQKLNAMHANVMGINEFYKMKGRLPQNLIELQSEYKNLSSPIYIQDPGTQGIFQYKIADSEDYFLCLTFMKDGQRNKKGYQCDLFNARGSSSQKTYPTPIPGDSEIISTIPAASKNSWQLTNTTDSINIEKNLFVEITSFKIEDGGSVRISVEASAQVGPDYTVDLSNIKMRFSQKGGSTVVNSPLTTNTIFTLHPPTKIVQDLSFYGIGKGVVYEFEYSLASGNVKLGNFH